MPRYVSDRSILNPRRPVMPHLETLPPYLTRIVVGDLHGDLEGLRALLAHLGVIDRHNRRCDGFHIVQRWCGVQKSVELNPRLKGGQKMNMLTKP